MGGTIALVLLAATWAGEGVSPARAVLAQSGDEAEQLMRQGIELRRAGRDEEALTVFRRAESLGRSARARAQVGLAEQALGRWVAANRDLTSALQANNDPWIVKNRAVLESAQSVVRDHVGQVTISGSPAGATVLINGEKAGTLPLREPVVVATGDSVVTIEAPGRISISRKINVVPHGLVRETIDLPPGLPPGLPPDLSSQPRAAERPSTATPHPTTTGPMLSETETTETRPATAAPAVVAAPVDARPVAPSAIPGSAGRGGGGGGGGGRVVAWIALGLGVAALGVGTVADIRYVGDVRSFNAPASVCAAGVPNRGSAPGCAPAYDNMMRDKSIAVAGFVSGAALGVLAAVLFYWTSSDGEAGGGSTTASARVACTARGIGAGCGIVF